MMLVFCIKSIKVKDKRRATIDHILPRSCGGTDAYVNLRLICAACNNEILSEQINKQIPGANAFISQMERDR